MQLEEERKEGRKEEKERKVGKEGRDKEGRKRNLLISSDINVIWKAERIKVFISYSEINQ